MLVFRPDHTLELVLDTEQPTPIVPLGWQSGGLKGICGRKVASGKITHSRSVDEMAKGQLRSNREKKKKPKADKNKKKAAPVASPFTPAWPTGQKTVGRKFS